MKKNVLFKGKTLRREVENLGDVEKVRWYEYKPVLIGGVLESYSDSEIYDQEELEEIELFFESICIANIVPLSPII